MIIALASPRIASTLDEGLDKIKRFLAEASAQGAEIVCFPQAYVPGDTRRLFEINGVKLGVAICHEGWRYPETVRWAAVRGAKIVFHPHHTGSDQEGVRLTQWGAASGPYYEKAMTMRSMENTIYFASVNYALRFQESATSLIAPSGQCQAYLPYGQEGVLVQAINVEEATGLLATRYAPERYQECRLA